LLTGLAALALMAIVDRTRLATMAAVIALLIPTLIVIAVGADVLRVNDVGEIVRGLPTPVLPHLGDLSFKVIVGAFAVAAIVLVQGAGVAEAAPNPPGEPADANRDFIAQGVGNVASGLFKGQPVGGSVGSTALNKAGGARSRWASIFTGLWMAVILVALSGLVGKVAMPTLAAVLIYAGIGSIRPHVIRIILRTGPISQIAFVTTFVATLFLPVAVAVGIGVALSLLLQLNQEALDLRVVELVRRPDGQVEERPAPKVASAHAVILLDVYGSLYYAGARTLQAHLPDPAGVEEPVVILRLRGRTSAGTTFFTVIADYATQIDAAGGRLYLSGIDPELGDQMRRSLRHEVAESIHPFEATPIIGQSSWAATRDATHWLVRNRANDVDDGEKS
jgi:SulP family sulfate permease